jgi:hypothetical protein
VLGVWNEHYCPFCSFIYHQQFMQYRVLSLASRTGDTEEAIGKDAQSLLWLFLEVYERGEGMGVFPLTVGAGKGHVLHSAILLTKACSLKPGSMLEDYFFRITFLGAGFTCLILAIGRCLIRYVW